MRRRSTWLWAGALVAYAFLYLPLVIVVVYSFNDSRLNAEWVGFTLDWYRRLAANDDMLAAAGNSLLIALVASLVSTILGTMAGIAMHRYRLRLLPLLVLTPIAIPDILGGPEDSLIGNVIKQQFLETRDWPFGSVLSIVLTVCALGVAGLAAWVGRRGVGRLAA